MPSSAAAKTALEMWMPQIIWSSAAAAARSSSVGPPG